MNLCIHNEKNLPHILNIQVDLGDFSHAPTSVKTKQCDFELKSVLANLRQSQKWKRCNAVCNFLLACGLIEHNRCKIVTILPQIYLLITKKFEFCSNFLAAVRQWLGSPRRHYYSPGCCLLPNVAQRYLALCCFALGLLNIGVLSFHQHSSVLAFPSIHQHSLTLAILSITIA